MMLRHPITLDVFVYSNEEEQLEEMGILKKEFDRENDLTQPYTFYHIDCVAPSKYEGCSIIYFGGECVIAKVPINVLRENIEHGASGITITNY